jgi:DNA-binding XRE family transcriptional regulator
MNVERAANAIDRMVGQKVRTRRLEIGMSQERLTELLGVTFQQVQKYEKGVNRIAVSRLWTSPIASNCRSAASSRPGHCTRRR